MPHGYLSPQKVPRCTPFIHPETAMPRGKDASGRELRGGAEEREQKEKEEEIKGVEDKKWEEEEEEDMKEI